VPPSLCRIPHCREIEVDPVAMLYSHDLGLSVTAERNRMRLQINNFGRLFERPISRPD
jgi:hypothetical protein